RFYCLTFNLSVKIYRSIDVKNNLYYADLEIGNLSVKDILIDTGYSRSDLVLEEKFRQSLKDLLL
ncbi:hypothetical protein, partial [Phocaeicola coprophilus]|uniref:hypothetical protein n=1 Tax=Phocaeicola coprophilus TaxID=387090 RepID=UPI002943EEDB